MRSHCASLVGRQPPISYIYRGGVTTLRTREWSLISSPSRHGVHRMHGLDGATGYRIERCRLCACTAQPLLRPKQLPGPALACWTLTPFFPAVERSRCMTSHCGARCMLVLSLSARPFTHPVAASCTAGTNHPRSRAGLLLLASCRCQALQPGWQAARGQKARAAKLMLAASIALDRHAQAGGGGRRAAGPGSRYRI